MSGASDRTLRVTHLNANWSLGGGFELLIVTEDDERRTTLIGAQDLAAIGAVVREDRPVLWDPEGGTLILIGVLGTWLPADWRGLPG